MNQTKAEEQFGHVLSSAAQASIALLEAKMDACSTEREQIIALGLDPAKVNLSEPGMEESIALRAAFRQLGLIFSTGSTLSMSRDEIAVLGATAKAPTTIEIERSTERVLTDFYEHGNAEFVGRFFSRPGAVESIIPDRQVIELHHYEDGSMLMRLQSLSKPNLDLRNAMLAQATSVDEAMNVKEATELKQAFSSAAEHIAESNKLGPAALKLIPGLIAEETLTMVRGITAGTSESITSPAPNHDNVLAMMQKSVQEGAWKEGVEVSVDGKKCADLAEFKQALGLAPVSSLDDAMARLRSARAAKDVPPPSDAPKLAKPGKRG